MIPDNWLNDFENDREFDPDEAAAKGCMSVGMTFIVFIVACVICALVGCTTTKYVPVIEHHTDTLIQVRVQKDSVLLKDSVFINQYIKGDTVFRDRDHWHTEYRDRWLTDTMLISCTDSIPTPYPVEKKVPAELSWWQQTQMRGFWLLLLIALLALGWKYRKKIKAFIKCLIG